MRIAFLLYESRSGSTLLASLLDQLQGVSVLPETQFAARLLENWRALGAGQDPDRIVALLRQEPHFDELEIAEEKLRAALLNAGTPIGLPDALRAVVEVYVAEQNITSSVVVVKGGRAAYHASLIHDLLPESIFIHIVRDGRAVHSSRRLTHATNRVPMSDSVIRSALDWRRYIRLCGRVELGLISVRFEDLVSNPEQEITKLCRELGLEGVECHKSKDQESYARRIGATQRALHGNVGRPPDPQHKDKWRTNMTVIEKYFFERIAGAELVQLGYPLSREVSTLPVLFKAGLSVAYRVARVWFVAYWAVRGSLRVARDPERAARLRARMAEWRAARQRG